MNNDRKIIIALIAVCVVVLAGVAFLAPNIQNQNQTAYEIPLKTQAFSFFDMATPIGSDFKMKHNQSEANRGFVSWQNNGNFSNDTDLIIISKNYTDKLIPEKMELVSQNDSQKVYMSENIGGNYYKIVKTVNDTDIIVSGHNLHLLEEMANSTAKVKDTSKLIQKETKVENKTPVKQVIEKKTEQKKEKPQPKPDTPKDPLMIGGGSFSTGSDDADKTYARIYVGKDHAGEDVGIKIFYSRNGTSLNQGNYVTATIKSDGYINIASADAYKYYPDFARIELYNSSGSLVATQGVHLNPTSGTQYF